jgi:PucR C-terminal helix-turn-helix domain
MPVVVTLEDQALYVSVLERLDVPTLADSVVEMVCTEIPAYAALPEAVVRGQIRDITQHGIELFLRLMKEGQEPTPEELDALRESAANRASEGLALSDLMQAYRIGVRHVWHTLTTAAETPAERDALLRMVWPLMEYLDRISSAAAGSYLAVREHDISEEARRSRELFDRLCAGDPIDEPLRAFAHSRGFPVLDVYRPFAFAAPGTPPHVHSQLAASLRLAGTLALTEGERVVGLAPPEETGATLGADRHVLVLGRPCGRAALGGGLDQARSLLALALGAGRRLGNVDAREFLVDLLLHDAEGAVKVLEEHVLGPLERPEPMRRIDAVATLEAYVESGLDRRRAAQRLDVHPNTFDHRLARIAQAGGVDPRSPDGLALVVLALRVQRRRGAPRPL